VLPAPQLEHLRAGILALTIVCTPVKATVGLDIHAVMLTKRSGPDGNEKGDVPLGNPTLPEDSTGIAESPAQTSVLKRTLALLYPLNI